MEKEIDHEHKFDGKQDRNYHQKPFDDVTDNLGQIDDESAALADKAVKKDSASEEDPKKDSDTNEQQNPEKATEINDSDVRDQNDSTKDWDAENSRTGRNK